jgi:hypothetical protein
LERKEIQIKLFLPSKKGDPSRLNSSKSGAGRFLTRWHVGVLTHQTIIFLKKKLVIYLLKESRFTFLNKKYFATTHNKK